MPGNDDLALLIDAIGNAGDIAMSFCGPTTKAWDKADGAGPVTEADLAVNQALQSQLRRARPDYGWLSEESEDDVSRLTQERVFIVDPIDGTRSFIEGADTWAHSIAVADRGRVTAAAIFLPARGLLYAATSGGGATLNGTPIQISSRDALSGARVLSAKPNYAPQHWRGTVPDVERHYRPSLAYRLALVAQGRFDAMLTLRPTWEWDIAAGALIIAEAGGQISNKRGEALQFNGPNAQFNGILAAPKVLHQQLIEALAD